MSALTRLGLLSLSFVVAACSSVPAPGKSVPDPDPVAVDGFVGTWIEHWPGVDEQATHVISGSREQYAIEGSSQITEAFPISNVRLEGDVLKFSEGTTQFSVEYELRVQDAQTLSVRGKGMEGWEDVVWTRTE